MAEVRTAYYGRNWYSEKRLAPRAPAAQTTGATEASNTSLASYSLQFLADGWKHFAEQVPDGAARTGPPQATAPHDSAQQHASSKSGTEPTQSRACSFPKSSE